MEISDEATEVAIDRLRQILPARAPALFEALREPASFSDIEDLKRVIDPWPLPAPIETWLRFADGSRLAFPIVDSRFLGASEIVEFYTEGLEFDNPGLLPFSYQSHDQASIVMSRTEPQVIVDTCVESVEWRLLAPSFPEAVGAIADLAESGLLSAGYPPTDVGSFESPESVKWREAYKLRELELTLAMDWSFAPFPPREYFDRMLTPQAWGPNPQMTR